MRQKTYYTIIYYNISNRSEHTHICNNIKAHKSTTNHNQNERSSYPQLTTIPTLFQNRVTFSIRIRIKYTRHEA